VEADGHAAVVPGAEWRSALYGDAVTQFERAAEVLDLDPEFHVRLLEPRRSLTVNFPVRLDDGEVRSFTGYRVQHTLTMGPTKGGFRYSPQVSLGECAGPGHVDDVEVLAAGAALRRGQGWRALRSQRAVAR